MSTMTAPGRNNGNNPHGQVLPHRSLPFRKYYHRYLCTLLFSCILSMLPFNTYLMFMAMEFNSSTNDRFLRTSQATDDIRLIEHPRRTKDLGPGDLPGYTGWARPALTLAGWFQIEEARLKTTAGSSWKATVSCHHDLCRSGGALFDVRAYGPAIIPGTVIDHRDGTYELSMFFFDEGSYTVEWVLAFSKPPSFDTLPRNIDVHYEGYLLPGFPLTVEVTTPTTSWYHLGSLSSAMWPSGSDSSNEYPSAWRRILDNRGGDREDVDKKGVDDGTVRKPTCTMSDILQREFTSIMHQGRWLVEDRVTDPIRTAYIKRSLEEREGNNTTNTKLSGVDDSTPNPFAQVNVSLKEYESGLNSIGFRMGFHRPSCYLPTMEEIRPRVNIRKRRFLLIGDSNMRKQEKLLVSMNYSSTRIDLLPVNGGLQITLPSVQEELRKLAMDAHSEMNTTDYYIFFNAGLHEIGHMCLMVTMRTFLRQLNSTVPIEELGPCTERYRYYLTELILAVQAFPAKLAMFQTTVAGWSKWGNYGFGWSPTSGQTLPKANQVVEHFNRIAWDLMQEHKVPTVDAYWRSVARPDHREVTASNDIGAHLVHLGPENYDLYMREWTWLVVQSDKAEGHERTSDSSDDADIIKADLDHDPQSN